MSICVASVVTALSLAGNAFVLSWTHSVERTTWQEHWVVSDDGKLKIDWARVQGSGAGMEPPPDAVLRDGWWTYRPDLPAQDSAVLAVSGATVGGWRLCIDGAACHDIENQLSGGGKIDLLKVSAAEPCLALPD